MIVVKLMGGLGNQLFQYAFGRALSKRLNRPLILDLDFLLDRSNRTNFVFRDFDLDIFQLSEYELYTEKNKKKFNKKSILRFLNPKTIIYQEEKFSYKKNTELDLYDNIYLDGYWQSYKYFNSIEEDIRNEFKIKAVFTPNQQALFEEITNSKSICVNFRRTDFVTIPSAIQTHGVPTMDYYLRAVEVIKDKIGDDIKLFVFSDDIAWCEQNFKTEINTYYVGHELYKGDRFASYLGLMQACKHFIIPNSTFAWWAAWLSLSKEKVVITPEQWFVDAELQSQTQDLRPENWMKL